MPDPTYQVVTDGLAVLREQDCDGILAIGGGSSIDAAKVISVVATNPGDPSSFVGFGKVKKQPLPLFAIATTSGTGSEGTMGAVISDSVTHEKAVITDGKLLPKAVALDPLLITGLPSHITAATGMDALTHAIEAYIGKWDFGNSSEMAILATKLIFRYLPSACKDGEDIEARDAMSYAAYCAGLAINKANTGNVHALSHQLGGHYGIAHGLANAVVLPHVLDFSLVAAEGRLADLARELELDMPDASDRELAQQFVAAVRTLNQRIGIAETLAELKEQDIPALATAAVKEGINTPSPRFMSAADGSAILRKILP